MAAVALLVLLAAGVAFLRPALSPAASAGPATEVASQPQFVDALHGWLYVTRTTGIGLYATVDGGAHWNRVYARESGAFHFFDRSNGVLFDADGWVELTSNGGRSWQAAGILPAYSNVTQAGMAFFGDTQRGVALVWRPDNTAAVLLTTDAQHWRNIARIPLARPFSLVANSQVALLLAAGAVSVSRDGGSTWEAEAAHDDPGWATLAGDSLVLGYRATDDGVNWRLEFPQLQIGRQFHNPALFYGSDGTAFVLDSFLLGKSPDSRLFIADKGSWRLLKLP